MLIPYPCSAKNDVTCTLCTFIFQGLDDILMENEGSVSI